MGWSREEKKRVEQEVAESEKRVGRHAAGSPEQASKISNDAFCTECNSWYDTEKNGDAHAH